MQMHEKYDLLTNQATTIDSIQQQNQQQVRLRPKIKEQLSM
jgi:hypothetical protein